MATLALTEKTAFVQKPGNGQLKYNMGKTSQGRKIGYGTFTQLDGTVVDLVAWSNDQDFVICNFSIDTGITKAQAELAKENVELKARLLEAELSHLRTKDALENNLNIPDVTADPF